MSYIDCFVAPVPTKTREQYLEFSKVAGKIFRECGVTRIVEYWGDDVPPGEVTSFPLAVKCKDDETVAVSIMEWPSKKARDEGTAKMMADPRMMEIKMPFDGKRAIIGGFETLLEH